jgi:hypothetical protein
MSASTDLPINTLWIDHVGYCKGPNPLLRIGQNIIVIGRIRSRP